MGHMSPRRTPSAECISNVREATQVAPLEDMNVSIPSLARLPNPSDLIKGGGPTQCRDEKTYRDPLLPPLQPNFTQREKKQ